MQGRLQLFGVARAGGEKELPDTLPGYLLAYLAYRADWVARDTLTGLFWPDRRETDALHNLRANLHRVRRLLAPWSLAASFDSQTGRVRLLLPTDTAEFRRELGRGDWSRAVELQHGPLLSSLSFRGFPLLEEWARVEREALAAAWRDAAMKCALQHETSGQAARAADTLLLLLNSGEAPEDAVQALLRVAAEAGRRDEALGHYDRLLAALRNDAGLEPMQETTGLARVLRQPELAAHHRTTAAPVAAVPRAVLHPPRLFGRVRECGALADAARPLLVIAGEPGVGKTRLLEEALPLAWWFVCREGQEEVPFAPITELIEDQRDSLPDLPLDQRRELARLVPALLAGEQLPPADAAVAKTRLHAAIAQLLEARPAAVVIDDAQWADAATRELIVFLARRARLPLRLAYRSNEQHADLRALLEALDATAPLEQIELAPFTPAELLELLATISHADAGPELFGRWLHQRTGGNAFFVLQTLCSLFESGRLAAGDHGWASALDEITTDYSELQIPPRVADLVRRRVRGLSESARRVLTAVVVAGGARAVEPLAAMVGLSAWATAEAVAEMQSAGLLREHRLAHDIARQSIYRATPEAVRRVLHAGVARHFAGVLRDEQIAEHWWLAHDVQRSLDATVLATAGQRQAGLHDEALALTARALPRAVSSAQRALLHALRARIHLEQGDLAGAEAAAAATLDEAAWPHERAEAFIVIASARLQQGKVDEAHEALLQATASDAEHDALCIERARVAQLQGRVADALADLERRCAQLRTRPPGRELVQVLTSLGAAFDELGQPQRGLVLHQEAYRHAGRLNARYAQVEVAINLLWALSTVGRNDEAVAVAEEALALGEYDSTPTLRNNLAWSLRELGRIDDAMRLCEQLAAGRDPTLALIARARLLDMRKRKDPTFDAGALVDALLADLGSTDVYSAQLTAAKAVLQHGDAAQVQRVLPWLRPQPLDPWLHRELSSALAERGIEPLAYLGEAAAPVH